MKVTTQNRQLHYLFSLETSLTERAKENQEYESRLQEIEERNNVLNKTLEKIKGLVIEGQVEKLQKMLRKGEI